MLDNETKEKFILLRAENKSYSKISKALGISIDSCYKLNAEFENRIAELKADNMQQLYNKYFMTKEARIKKLGSSLNKIDKAIEQADFSGIAPEKLLDLKLKYSQALKKEFTAPADKVEISTITPEAIYSLMLDLLNRVRAGLIDDIQAQKEFTVISGLQKSYEDIELNEKMESLKMIMEHNTELITSKDL